MPGRRRLASAATERAAALEELLARFPSLSDLPGALAHRLSTEAEWREIADGAQVFGDASRGRSFPFLLAGRVRVGRRGANGREVLLYRVEAGGCCVASASEVLGGRTCQATGVAEGRVRLLTVSPELFDALVAGHAPFRRFVFAEFGSRLASLSTMVDTVAFQRLDQRLAAILVAHGRDWHVSQQALADQLGSVREVVGRVLRDFARRGFIELGRSRVHILDAAGLATIAVATGPVRRAPNAPARKYRRMPISPLA